MNQMHLGIPSLIELKSLNDCAALCKELDLQFVELNMNLPEYQAERIAADAFAKTAERKESLLTHSLKPPSGKNRC